MFFKRKKKHIWKETGRENLGAFLDIDNHRGFVDCQTMYRTAIYEKCLLTGDERILEVTDLFPA